jgi:hypothetical protein
MLAFFVKNETFGFIKFNNTDTGTRQRRKVPVPISTNFKKISTIITNNSFELLRAGF